MSSSRPPSVQAASRPARTVRELMRTDPTTIGPDAHVASAAYLMKRTPCNALVVAPEGDPSRPVGLLADADITRAVADGLDLDDTRIHQLHLPRPEPVDPGTPVTAAAERMLADSLGHLPVVEDGRLVGLVDLAAVCGALLTDAREMEAGSAGGDAAGGTPAS